MLRLLKVATWNGADRQSIGLAIIQIIRQQASFSLSVLKTATKVVSVLDWKSEWLKEVTNLFFVVEESINAFNLKIRPENWKNRLKEALCKKHTKKTTIAAIRMIGNDSNDRRSIGCFWMTHFNWVSLNQPFDKEFEMDDFNWGKSASPFVSANNKPTNTLPSNAPNETLKVPYDVVHIAQLAIISSNRSSMNISVWF